jgi:enoyl-CoA hydratase
MIRIDQQDELAVLHMEHGKANAFDREFMASLSNALLSVEQSDAKAVIITGSGSIFSAGVDLFRILEGKEAYIQPFLAEMSAMLETLFLFPRPVISAVNGHAIAGGCIIALASDYALMSRDGGTIGIPELLVGVPFPSLPLEIVRFALAPHVMQRMIYSGITYHPEDALKNGVVQELADPDDLLRRANEIAAGLMRIPEASFRLVKTRLRMSAVDKSRATGDAEVLQLWNSPEIHDVIRAYLDRTIRRK